MFYILHEINIQTQMLICDSKERPRLCFAFKSKILRDDYNLGERNPTRKCIPETQPQERNEAFCLRFPRVTQLTDSVKERKFPF